MDMRTIIHIQDLVTSKIQTKYNQLKNKVNDILDSLREMVREYPGVVIICTMMIIFPFNDLLTISISGFLIYMAVLAKQYIKNKIEKETLENLDIDRFGNSMENKKSVIDIINEYIENCFDRDVLFFNIIDRDDYIDTETERRLLNELLDSALLNMSEEMRINLSRYVSEEGLTRIIGRRCMMVVTIFVANHNKNIYQQRDENKRIEI